MTKRVATKSFINIENVGFPIKVNEIILAQKEIITEKKADYFKAASANKLLTVEICVGEKMCSIDINIKQVVALHKYLHKHILAWKD